VIATIILIGAVIVLSAVAGIYMFSIVGSNVQLIEIRNAMLYSGSATFPSSLGSANFDFTTINPGPATNISSIVISSAGFSGTPSIYRCQTTTSCSVFVSAGILGGRTTDFNNLTNSFYLGTYVLSGITCTYVINFGNGQSITGSLIAQ